MTSIATIARLKSKSVVALRVLLEPPLQFAALPERILCRRKPGIVIGWLLPEPQAKRMET